MSPRLSSPVATRSPRFAHATRALIAAAIGACCGLVATSARAQSLGLGRRLDSPIAPAIAGDAPAREETSDDEPEGPWAGPQVQLHYGFFHLADGVGGGDVHSGGVGVFIQWPEPAIRTAIRADAGSRNYSLGGEDFVLRAQLEIGAQLVSLIDPLVPFVSLVIPFGAVVGQRFETPVSYAFGGLGLELGASLRIYRNLHVTAALGYQRLEMDGAAFDVFSFRVGAGL